MFRGDYTRAYRSNLSFHLFQRGVEKREETVGIVSAQPLRRQTQSAIYCSLPPSISPPTNLRLLLRIIAITAVEPSPCGNNVE